MNFFKDSLYKEQLGRAGLFSSDFAACHSARLFNFMFFIQLETDQQGHVARPKADLLTFWFSNCWSIFKAPKGQPCTSRSFGQVSQG